MSLRKYLLISTPIKLGVVGVITFLAFIFRPETPTRYYDYTCEKKNSGYSLIAYTDVGRRVLSDDYITEEACEIDGKYLLGQHKK